jgi:hypothetical protein
VGPDLELRVDLSAEPPVRSPAFGTLVRRSASTLSATAIKDHLDVRVVPEPIDQIFIEAGLVAGNKK